MRHGLLGLLLLWLPAAKAGNLCRDFLTRYSSRFFPTSFLSSTPDLLQAPVTEANLAETIARSLLETDEGGEPETTDLAMNLIEQLVPEARQVVYRQVRDKIALHLVEYQQAIEIADRVLPSSGLIADLGCGTGAACSVLRFASPSRSFLLVDWDKRALALAESRLQSIEAPPGASPATTQVLAANLLNLNLRSSSLDAAILNRSLSYIPEWSRKTFLQGIYKALTPGGVLFLNEEACSTNPLRRIAQHQEALRNGANLTRFELAVLEISTPECEQEDRRIPVKDAGLIEQLAATVGFELLPEFSFDSTLSFRRAFRKP